MSVRFIFLSEKGSVLVIIFLLSDHFKHTFIPKVDLRFQKSSVFLVGEAKIKLLITLIFFLTRQPIFFVGRKYFLNLFFFNTLNNAPTAAFRASQNFIKNIRITQKTKNVLCGNQQLIVQKKFRTIVVTFFYLLSLSSH